MLNKTPKRNGWLVVFMKVNLLTRGMWAVRAGGVTFRRVSQRERNQYLHKEIQSLKKTTRNSNLLDRRARLSSKPAPSVYRFRGYLLSSTGTAQKRNEK